MYKTSWRSFIQGFILIISSGKKSEKDQTAVVDVEPNTEKESPPWLERVASFLLLSLPLIMNHRQTICESERGEGGLGELGNRAITIAITLRVSL